MDEKIFTMILDRIKDFTDYLYFHVKGEPLLHPLIDSFLDVCAEQNCMVNLATNGTLIAKTGEKLAGKPALRQVSFSLHSLEEQKDASKRKQYLDDVISFTLKALPQSPVIIEYKLWNLEHGVLNDSNRFILDYVCDRLGLRHKIHNRPDFTGRMKLSDRVFLNIAERFSWPDISSAVNSTKGFCYGLRTQAAILVDGTVVPCCLDSEGVMKLGNIHESLFSDIINGERAVNITDGFSNRIAVEEMCRKCTYRNRFDL